MTYNASPSESLILRNTTHTGPVRGLDFNPLQTSLLSSGAIKGEASIRCAILCIVVITLI
jgi:protein transport protein SEC31